MTKESLEKALDLVIEAIAASDIDSIDKVELLINVRQFLLYSTYEENIAVLREHEEGKKHGR